MTDPGRKISPEVLERCRRPETQEQLVARLELEKLLLQRRIDRIRRALGETGRDQDDIQFSLDADASVTFRNAKGWDDAPADE
jgi:hypothetical protein